MPIQAFVFDAYGTLFDTQSVAAATEAAFPPYGDLIAQVWRQKQLEYTWLRSAMAAHADFETVTREALLYALGTLAIEAPQAVVDEVCAAFDHLEPYPDARETLTQLSGYRLAILSNGSPAMLTALLGHAGFDRFFEAVVSAEPTRFYKPHPAVYGALTHALGLQPADILLVSSNGFDLAGARHFGLQTARIGRLLPEHLRERLADPTRVAPQTMFAALRSQPDIFAGQPHFACTALHDLIALAPSIARSRI